jgi:hypothetical protein
MGLDPGNGYCCRKSGSLWLKGLKISSKISSAENKKVAPTGHVGITEGRQEKWN